MAEHGSEFDGVVRSAQRWLSTIAEELDDDHDLAYRAARAWLHAVRDRLPVADAAHFAAQLPVLLRGMFYEGWQPSRVPVKYSRAEFVERYARECGVTTAEVPFVTRVVSRSLDRHTPGFVETVLHRFPQDLADLLAPNLPTSVHELLGD